MKIINYIIFKEEIKSKILLNMNLKIFKLFLIFFFIIILILNYKYIFNNKIFKTKLLPKLRGKLVEFDFLDIHPEQIERNVFNEIKDRIHGSLISLSELYFINGLIRKFRPKKILEIGVCTGGTSATILNAIKDIKGAMLYSCDLEKKHYFRQHLDIGYIVKDYFPEFSNKWKLFIGNTTASFIEEIGPDIDFAFIDTSHVMPGEVLNVIEILPFLKKNAIIAFDDIDHQVRSIEINSTNFHSCNNLLFSVLRGKKIIYNQYFNNSFNYKKLGAVILDDNQKYYFFEYFYLLANTWSYMPKKFEIYSIRNIVKKYYHPFFLSIFDKAVELNYRHLKLKGLLQKDYILYTFDKVKRKNPF